MTALPTMPKPRAKASEWDAYERAYAEWLLEERGALYKFTGEGTMAVAFTDVDEYFAAREDVLADADPRGRTGSGTPGDPAKKARLAEALAYVRDYTGSWGLILDIRSDRRFGTAHMTLSDRQVEVILAGKARDAARVADLAAGLEQARINTEIANADEYLAWYARQAAGGSPVTVVAPVSKPVTDGLYRMADGTIAKVQIAKNGSGNLYAKRLVVGEGFAYEPGLIRRLTADMRMTLEEAAEFGKLYGVCCVCGRDLTDEASIAAGIGPVCAGRQEWAA